MSDTITIPTPAEIAARIRTCREELTALRKLQRLARAAEAARQAQQRNNTPPTEQKGDAYAS
jgi:hypothetical protein